MASEKRNSLKNIREQPEIKKEESKFMFMTPLNYSYLQSQGFKLLIPIVSQNQNPRDEALTMWGKEVDDKVIRLEHHTNAVSGSGKGNTVSTQSGDQAPFHPEGLRVFIGDKAGVDVQFEGTVFFVEELEHYLQSGL